MRVIARFEQKFSLVIVRLYAPDRFAVCFDRLGSLIMEPHQFEAFRACFTGEISPIERDAEGLEVVPKL